MGPGVSKVQLSSVKIGKVRWSSVEEGEVQQSAAQSSAEFGNRVSELVRVADISHDKIVPTSYEHV